MSASKQASVHQRWAHLRFSVIGQLLAAPPPKGMLRAEIRKLAERTWQHPTSGEPVRFAASTIERWLLRSRRERRDPVAVLRRKVRADAGVQQLSAAIRALLRAQHPLHPRSRTVFGIGRGVGAGRGHGRHRAAVASDGRVVPVGLRVTSYNPG